MRVSLYAESAVNTVLNIAFSCRSARGAISISVQAFRDRGRRIGRSGWKPDMSRWRRSRARPDRRKTKRRWRASCSWRRAWRGRVTRSTARLPTASAPTFSARPKRYDAVVLDLGLPKIDGLTVLRRWRDAGIAVPVLVLTARAAAGTRRCRAIDGGADDYVAKPFSMEEVLARLRALIQPRQRTGHARSCRVALSRSIRAPRRVTVNGAPVKLTSHEFRVLSHLDAPAR